MGRDARPVLVPGRAAMLERDARRSARRSFLTTNDQRARGMGKEGAARSTRTVRRIHRRLEAIGAYRVEWVKRSGAARRPGELDCLRVVPLSDKPLSRRELERRLSELHGPRAAGWAETRFQVGVASCWAWVRRCERCVRPCVRPRCAELGQQEERPPGVLLVAAQADQLPPTSSVDGDPAAPGPPFGGGRISDEEAEAAKRRFRELKRSLRWGPEFSARPAQPNPDHVWRRPRREDSDARCNEM